MIHGPKLYLIHTFKDKSMACSVCKWKSRQNMEYRYPLMDKWPNVIAAIVVTTALDIRYFSEGKVNTRVK